jgi:exopolysaccharide production protein ExoZ
VWNNYLHGDLGTDMFFLVSGICLSLNSHALSAGEFVRRRLARILPAYWIVLTVYLLLHGRYLELRYDTANLVAHYLGVHALFGDAWAFAINDSFWFITAILLYYGAYLLLRPLLKEPERFLLIVAALSAAGAYLIFWRGQGGLMGRWGFRMPDFLVGMLIGHALRQGKLTLAPTLPLGLALVLLLYLPYARGIVFHPGAVGLGMILIFVAAVRPLLSRTAAGKSGLSFLGFVGRHSLEIFLIHQPLMREYNRLILQKLLHTTEPAEYQLVVGIVVSVAVTLVLAVELHRITGAFVKAVLPRRESSGRGVAEPLTEPIHPAVVVDGDPLVEGEPTRKVSA